MSTVIIPFALREGYAEITPGRTRWSVASCEAVPNRVPRLSCLECSGHSGECLWPRLTGLYAYRARHKGIQAHTRKKNDASHARGQ